MSEEAFADIPFPDIDPYCLFEKSIDADLASIEIFDYSSGVFARKLVQERHVTPSDFLESYRGDSWSV